MKMKVTVFLFLSLFTSAGFSETRDFNCVFDKWGDHTVTRNTFWSLTKVTDKTYTDKEGKEYSVFFEDNKTISLVSKNNFYGRGEVDVIVINKKNKNITKSLTLDDLVTVIKGNCE